MNTVKYNITYLEISSWHGISIGATHCYGKLYNTNTQIELTHSLTLKEAMQLNCIDNILLDKSIIPEGPYIKGMQTERFNSEKQLINVAKKQYKLYFPKSEILLLGEHVPAIVLDYPIKFNIKLARKIYNQAKKLNFYKYPENDNKMDNITQQFKKLYI